MNAPILLRLYQAAAALPPGTPFPVHSTASAPPLRPVAVYRAGDPAPDQSQPFLYRRFPGFSGNAAYFEKMLCAEAEVYGYRKSPYDKDGDWEIETFRGREVWQHFQHNTLPVNIVDSECSDAEPLLSRWQPTVLVRPSFVGWVLTQAPKCTLFHLDPPYGDCYMYLCRGKKIWLFIPPEALAEVEQRHGFEIINRLPLPELLLLDDGFLWGKIQIGEMRAGDLIYFPDHWPHYVRTFEHSFGYGGYFGKNQAT